MTRQKQLDDAFAEGFKSQFEKRSMTGEDKAILAAALGLAAAPMVGGAGIGAGMGAGTGLLGDAPEGRGKKVGRRALSGALMGGAVGSALPAIVLLRHLLSPTLPAINVRARV